MPDGRARPGVDHLWAGWRLAYVEGGDPSPPPGEGSLFERLLNLPDDDERAYIVWRGTTCSALLNAYPYTNGHVMVLPNRAVADLEGLTDDEYGELWAAVRMAVTAVKAAYGPDGVNVGLNLGRAAGAGVPDHLHVHVLPRWDADTNFMTAVAETRVLPESLDTSWRKLAAAWPR
jgi:diadenosine tetraphosphate (Ap4A) HIT family hydrolase